MKHYQLPKEFATKWIDALRSGKYKQIKNTLCRDGGYCCLGVLGHINGLSDHIMSEFDDLFYERIPKDNLPKELFLSQEDTGKRDIQAVVAQLNDSAGYSFSEIADWIEQNVEFI